MINTESIEKKISISDWQIDSDGCTIEYYIEIDEEVIERRFNCDYWRFLKIMGEVLNFDFLDRNTIRYETIKDPYKPAEEVKMPIDEIIANPIVYFNSEQMKQIAVWHELQKLDK